jgi:L-2-hydroxyglutarate oxidase LhgO
MDEVNVTIIGGGVIGLAIAAELSKELDDIVLLEKHDTFGQEISSRNSEVIHAGIYYPNGSLKAKLCVQGLELLYEYCRENSVRHSRLGKLIVAVDQSELTQLEEFYKNGLLNGAAELKLIEKSDIRNIQPNVTAQAAIHSLNTGIVDAHSLMSSLYNEAVSSGVIFSFNSEVDLIARETKGYVIGIKKESYRFLSRIVINAAGLSSDHVASLSGIDIDKEGYRLGYRKGSYFSYMKKSPISMLVYPLPMKKLAGLGVHATLDLGGRLRFGPDSEQIDHIDYTVNADKRNAYFQSVSRFINGLDIEAFNPDMAGIRPALKGDQFHDFIIAHEAVRGMDGFVNAIGIESPGLTACLAIARHIKNLLKGI